LKPVAFNVVNQAIADVGSVTRQNRNYVRLQTHTHDLKRPNVRETQEPLSTCCRRPLMHRFSRRNIKPSRNRSHRCITSLMVLGVVTSAKQGVRLTDARRQIRSFDEKISVMGMRFRFALRFPRLMPPGVRPTMSRLWAAASDVRRLLAQEAQAKVSS